MVVEEEEDVLGFVRLSSSWWNLRFEVSSATGMMVVVHLSEGRAVVREMFFFAKASKARRTSDVTMPSISI